MKITTWTKNMFSYNENQFRLHTFIAKTTVCHEKIKTFVTLMPFVLKTKIH